MLEETIQLIVAFETRIQQSDGFKDVKDWLKSLKDRCIPQTKQEWSEKEKEKINSICNIVADKRNLQKQDYKSYYNSLIDWLKSLRPQKQWKPSEYEIQLLKDVASGVKDPVAYGASMGVIIGGLEQLKALL